MYKTYIFMQVFESIKATFLWAGERKEQLISKTNNYLSKLKFLLIKPS